jgi:protein XagA
MAAAWRKPTLRMCLAAALSCTAVTEGFAGAWTQPEGAGQIIFNPSLMAASRRFNKRGRPVRTDRFIKSESRTLIEYGFREDLTLKLATRQRVEGFSRGGDPQRVDTSTLGLGARLSLWRGHGIVVSGQVSLESGLERSLPALDRRHGARHEAEGRVLVGHGFKLFERDAFVEAQAGYRWRSGRHADEVLLDATFGLRPHPSVLVLLQSFNTLSLQRANGVGRTRGHKLQASVVVDLTQRWSVQAGVFASPMGRDTLREKGVMLGVWRKF